MEVPVTLFRVYLGMVTSFWSTFVLGGGGNVTFHGIYSFPRDSFIVNISMHFWATLDMTCSGSQGDLVLPVRGARDAPPMKSVSYHAVCAVISVSSDVKV